VVPVTSEAAKEIPTDRYWRKVLSFLFLCINLLQSSVSLADVQYQACCYRILSVSTWSKKEIRLRKVH